MKRYSQNDEQAIIAAYFDGRVGSFLDLGANDGETLSNTRALALAGWDGLCVDASPQAFAKLSALYAGNERIECVHAAIYSDNGSIVLHESDSHFREGDIGLLSTVVPDEMDRWLKTQAFEPVRVPCCTMGAMLNKVRLQRFDLTSIDIEGMDLMALQQMDLGTLGCSMLIVEVNERATAPYIDHCAKYDLRLKSRNGENLIFTL